jgi:hypothetical protein
VSYSPNHRTTFMSFDVACESKEMLLECNSLLFCLYSEEPVFCSISGLILYVRMNRLD